MDEVWRVITDAPRYEVSNRGRVRNTLTNRLLSPNAKNIVMLVGREGRINRSINRLKAIAFWEDEGGV